MEEERQEFSLCLDKSKDTNYLPLTIPDCNLEQGCTFVVKSSQDGSNYNIILTLKHPFEALQDTTTVKELCEVHMRMANERRRSRAGFEREEERPLKLVYRFIEQRERGCRRADLCAGVEEYNIYS